MFCLLFIVVCCGCFECLLLFGVVVLIEMCRGNVEEAEVVWKKLENCLSDFEGISHD